MFVMKMLSNKDYFNQTKHRKFSQNFKLYYWYSKNRREILQDGKSSKVKNVISLTHVDNKKVKDFLTNV